MLETWLLMFIVSGNDIRQPRALLGGEYQTEEECKRNAVIQLPHARKWFGHRVRWTCEKSK